MENPSEKWMMTCEISTYQASCKLTCQAYQETCEARFNGWSVKHGLSMGQPGSIYHRDELGGPSLEVYLSTMEDVGPQRHALDCQFGLGLLLLVQFGHPSHPFPKVAQWLARRLKLPADAEISWGSQTHPTKRVWNCSSMIPPCGSMWIIGKPWESHGFPARRPLSTQAPGVEQEWGDEPTGGAESSAEVETASWVNQAMRWCGAQTVNHDIEKGGLFLAMTSMNHSGTTLKTRSTSRAKCTAHRWCKCHQTLHRNLWTASLRTFEDSAVSITARIHSPDQHWRWWTTPPEAAVQHEPCSKPEMSCSSPKKLMKSG